MRLSKKLFQIFLFTFVCLIAHHKAYSQTTIETLTTYPPSTTISQNLIVNDTLIALGDLTLENNVVLTINTGGVVIIYGDLHTSNKITLDINSYLFVLGSITHNGASKHAEASISANSQVYVFGDVSSDFDNTDLACPAGDYEQGTQNNCGHGDLEDFIRNLDDIPEEITDLFGCQASSMPFYYSNGEPNSNSPVAPGGSIFLTANAGASYPASIAYYSWEGPEGFYYSSSSTQNATVPNNAGIEHSGYYTYTAMTTTGCFIRDSTYVLVSDCGFSSGYYSRDNYAGTWKEESTWGASDNSMVLPPPNNPNNSQAITVKGYVTLDDNLNLTGSQQHVCDTLVITGNLYMTSNSFTVAPGGVLIVLGDFEAGSGSLVNNEGGKIVFAGEFSKTYSYSFSGTGDTYVFDPDALSEGFTPTGNQDYLETNDPSLYNFYISLVGGVPPSADCEDVTIYLDEYGQASIEAEDVHEGPLRANLSYALSQSEFDCSHLGVNTIILTAANSGGASDVCAAEVTVEDNIAPIINTCPPDAEFDCIEDLPEVEDITDFETIGGEVSDNCNANSLTISYEDVTATASGCRVIRTYTITDESGNIATCEQEFTIRDDIDPVITCVDLTYMPANDDCSVTISVDKPLINVDTDNCGFGDIEPVYSYHLASDPENEITGLGDIPETSFPLGRTTIHWTFADECGNSVSSTQIIDVTFELSEISYDNGSSSTDAGSGVYPMQTSIHTYSVDSKIPEDGYSYQWKLFERNGESLGDAVDPAHYIIDQTGEYNMASVGITFSEALPAETEYFIAVEKRRNGILCAKQEVLPIKIHPHDFDVELLPTGSDCQAGETGTPSTILWEISFPEIVTEPFQFDYNITLDGNPICTGTVSGISYAAANVSHNSGCSIGEPPVPPYALVSKMQDSKTVRLEYVISSITGADLQIGLTIEATDAFEVSDSDISNNSEDVILWGVPNTSDIETD